MEPKRLGMRNPALMRKSQKSFSFFVSGSPLCSGRGGLTCEYDGVQAGFAPQLHEVNYIPEAEGGMASENHAGLPEVAAEISMDAGVVLQLVGLNQLETKQQKNHDSSENTNQESLSVFK